VLLSAAGLGTMTIARQIRCGSAPAVDLGLGKTSILKIWREHGLKPHLRKTFKVSRDPAFVANARDVVGLYLSPSERVGLLSGG
jgi:hypothetical protein